jgi:dolichol-phosphate mannosyltransferase
MTSEKLISIVLPTYNEELNIPIISEEIKKVFSFLPKYDYELIFVNDGSRDNSLFELEKAAKNNNKIKVISFSRNFGHQLALTAGYDYSKGDAVICMDSDLQHPPELIPELIKQWEDGYDIVYTIRYSKNKIPLFRRWISDFFYYLINTISDTKINQNAADFRLISRSALDEFLKMRETNRFLRGMVGWIGFKTTSVEYEVKKRIHGKSSYSTYRLLKFAIDAITSFSGAPLRFSFLFGLITAFLSFIYGSYLIGLYLFGENYVSGWLSVLVSILFLGGIQLVFIGIVGEYIYKIYSEIKGRPLYVIDKKININ